MCHLLEAHCLSVSGYFERGWTSSELERVCEAKSTRNRELADEDVVQIVKKI